jgi:hypothetical protein
MSDELRAEIAHAIFAAGDSYRAADAVLALPALQRLVAEAAEAARLRAVVERVRSWAAMNDDMAREYDEVVAKLSRPELIAEAQNHAEDCRAIAEGVRRALDGDQ